MTNEEFLQALDEQAQPTSNYDRVLALLWWVGRNDSSFGMNAREICMTMEAAGHPKHNVSRLNRKLTVDRPTALATGDAWRLHPATRRELEEQMGAFRKSQPAKSTSSLLPKELFVGTRGYLERVVHQVNASYDYGLYDCCAVMGRRVLETLIIELYEKEERAAEIKAGDGNFLMFAGLVSFLEHDGSIQLSRNTLKGLRDYKALGDLSAHNRRFNARKDDIDRVQNGLRVATEELLHLSGLWAGAIPSSMQPGQATARTVLIG